MGEIAHRMYLKALARMKIVWRVIAHFEAVSVDGGGDAGSRDSQSADGGGVSGGDQADDR